MITGINEWKIITKLIPYECKRKFDGRKYNSDQWWNNKKCQCEYKKVHVCEKDYLWNPTACSCENEKYLANIMDNSAITCDEIIEPYDEESKTIPTNFNEKRETCKMHIFNILLTFY